jgi:hypothetical protein
MVNGYENCYLKSVIGGPLPDQNGFTFAMRQNTPNNSLSNSSTPTSQQKHQGSKAWIAGPVIGAVAAVGIVLAVLWWRWTRRKETKGTQNVSQQEAWLKPELDITTVTAPRYELDSSTRHYEMESTANGHQNRES